MHQPQHPFESSKTTSVTAVTEIKISAYFKISAAQWDSIQDAVQWLLWRVVLIKHWFSNCKWKQNDSSSFDQQSRRKRKATASLSLKRLTAWDSIFGLHILLHPSIQNPSHWHLIAKFRQHCFDVSIFFVDVLLTHLRSAHILSNFSRAESMCSSIVALVTCKCSILRIFVSYDKLGSECKFCCHRVFIDSCSRLL